MGTSFPITLAMLQMLAVMSTFQFELLIHLTRYGTRDASRVAATATAVNFMLTSLYI